MVLVASVILGFVVDRDLGKSLLLIGFSLGVIGTISLEADISYGNIILMGSVLLIAVVVLHVVDRFVFKRHIVRSINTGRRWTTAERWYLIIVVGLAWVIMPFYFINSGPTGPARGARAHRDRGEALHRRQCCRPMG